MTCRRCITAGDRDNDGVVVQLSVPGCAFPNDVFVRGEGRGNRNWNCATAVALRSRMQSPDHGSLMRVSDEAFGALWIPDTYWDEHWDDDNIIDRVIDDQGTIVATWYKNRGHTAGMFWIVDDVSIPLPLAIAEAYLDHLDNLDASELV